LLIAGARRADVFDTIEAKRIVVRDAKGQPRIQLDGAYGRSASTLNTSISLFDGSGRTRIGLTVADDGKAGLSLHEHDQNDGASEPVRLFVTEKGSPYLVLENRPGTVKVTIPPDR